MPSQLMQLTVDRSRTVHRDHLSLWTAPHARQASSSVPSSKAIGAALPGRPLHIQLGCTSLDGCKQSVVGKVRVPHCALMVSVTEHTAYGVQIDSRVDHEGCG